MCGQCQDGSPVGDRAHGEQPTGLASYRMSLDSVPGAEGSQRPQTSFLVVVNVNHDGQCRARPRFLWLTVVLQTVCTFFQRGHCKYGDNCRYEHPRDTATTTFGSEREYMRNRPVADDFTQISRGLPRPLLSHCSRMCAASVRCDALISLTQCRLDWQGPHTDTGQTAVATFFLWPS
jgi:hypothetical protein